MLYLKRDKKDEENGASGNPFHNLEKTTVLQEARVFNETPIIPRRCIHILTKFLYILNQGETFGKTEATEAFFATTKLFQSKDVTLRRMVYLLIKELSTSAEDVIIVTSSLTKDMTGKEDLYRAAAIRTLCRITDTTMLQVYCYYCDMDVCNSLSPRLPLTDENHEAKESGLSHLCEFIEDCEHTVLSTRILHLLGREGPRTAHPAKYIRYVYNRVVLENAAVRAAAVSSLAKFGAHSEDMLPNVLVLLRRCLLDTDDEVRDRAIFYVNLLEQRERQLNCAYILTGLQVSVVGLEKALHHYTLDPRETPFDLKAVPLETQPLTAEPARAAATGSARAAGATAGGVDVAAAAATRQDVFAEQLAAIPAFADLGTLFRSSSPPAELTESETEYVVRCVKHTFPAHVVFQFDCTNTLDDQTLSDARVHMEPADPAFEVVETVPCTRLRYNAPGATYTCVRLPEGGVAAATCTFACALRFTVRDCDPGTGEEEPEDEGYADEYVLEDAELTMADHVRRVARPDFAAAWDAAGDDNEREDTFALSSAATVADAVRDVVAFLGMQPCERSDRVADGRSAHTLYLAGVFRGGHEALARARLAVADGGVTMQLCVRSDDPEVSDLIVSAIG
ncbi:PREDICTED: coatomer subunit gamma-2-like [Priapulus caudatus]|uniref:Coatomer subunit gamma-2-like n=1 Tax=Priapulus caudatus TaxID=37621 RepID=A0ABM1EMJ3_PRICU|nr:PREDICTED: coatomer subunit gamma-2-like [Priapulus caudatus]